MYICRRYILHTPACMRGMHACICTGVFTHVRTFVYICTCYVCCMHICILRCHIDMRIPNAYIVHMHDADELSCLRGVIFNGTRVPGLEETSSPPL